MMRVGSPLTWTVAQHAAAPVMAVSVAVALAAPPVPTALPSDPVAPVDVAGQVEAAAVELADELNAVPADQTDRLCSADELEVRWSEPVGFSHGAHMTPVGPRPDLVTRAVNGVVVCGESTWAYMGFEATRSGAGWDVVGVPYLEEGPGHGHGASLNMDAGPLWGQAQASGDHSRRWGWPSASESEAPDHGHRPDGGTGAPPPDNSSPAASASTPVPSPSSPTGTVDGARWLAGLGPIEPYASYDPQTTCTPVARAGTVTMRDALLGAHPVTRNLGIVRACHIGGRSEHKEGRAFDWGAYVSRPVERAAVERFVDQLFATDAQGNTHALARRMGVMYLVWNGQIWSAYRASEGWRPYSGPSPHTDHIHISLSRAGGDGRTSFYTQGLAQKGVLGLVPTGGGAATPVAAPAVGAPRHTPTPTPSRTATPRPSRDGGTPTPRSTPSTAPSRPSPTPTPTADGDAERRDDAEAAARREAERLEERRREEERREARRLEEERRRLEEARREEQRRAEEDARRAAEEARRAAERDAAEQRRAAEREAAEQQRAAEREARQKDRPERGGDGGPPAGRGKGRGGGKR